MFQIRPGQLCSWIPQLTKYDWSRGHHFDCYLRAIFCLLNKKRINGWSAEGGVCARLRNLLKRVLKASNRPPPPSKKCAQQGLARSWANVVFSIVVLFFLWSGNRSLYHRITISNGKHFRPASRFAGGIGLARCRLIKCDCTMWQAGPIAYGNITHDQSILILTQSAHHFAQSRSPIGHGVFSPSKYLCGVASFLSVARIFL